MKVAVVGYSCTGKTTLTMGLASLYPDHKIYHTDEYQGVADYYEAPEVIAKAILKDQPDNFIVSGIHAYRILRKGAEMRNLFVDTVIHCRASPQKQHERYVKERNPEQIHRQPAIQKSYDKIFNEYMGLCQLMGRVPNVIEYWS